MTRELTLTGIQTLAAVAAAVATFYAARMAQRSAQASEISATAAADAATASHRAINLTQEQFKHSARAYVVVENLTLGRMFEGVPLEVSLNFKNAGSTPALEGWVRYWFVTTQTPLTGNPPAQAPVAESKLLIGPQSAIRLSGRTEAITPGQLRAFEREEQYLYLAGIIDYKDAFTDEHQTLFCFRIMFNPPNHTTHTHHNSMT